MEELLFTLGESLMRRPHTLVKKLILSGTAVFVGFLGFSGVSMLAELIAGARPGHAFQHKLFFFFVLSVFQLGIVLGDPISSKFRVWLRVFMVVALCMFIAQVFSSELVTLRLFDTNDKVLLIGVSAIFSLLTGALLFRKLSNRLKTRVSAGSPTNSEPLNRALHP
jgi:hypothetical protein